VTHDRIRRVASYSLENVQGANGINLEIDQRNFFSFIVRRLSSAVNHQVWGSFPQQLKQAFAITYIDRIGFKSTRLALQSLEIRSCTPGGSEEELTHVIIDADYICTKSIPMQNRR